jgi:hypothetical protein
VIAAVDRLIGRKDFAAPPVGNGLADGRVFSEDRVAGAVGVQVDGAEFDKGFCGERLATGYAADETDDSYGCKF